MDQQCIEIEGQILSWYENRGSGHPILMLHGNSMSARCFERQFTPPLCTQYRLIALDLPGHGSSAAASAPETTYTLPGYAALLSGFVKQLGIEDALMVGWSLGGHILLEAANLLDKAAGFMLFGTPPISKPMAGDPFLPNPLFSCLFEKELSAEDAAAVAASFFFADKLAPDFFAKAMLSADGKARAALWQSVVEGTYTDEVTVAANLNKPLAIVHGEADCLVNRAYIRQLSMPTLWRGEVQVIDNAGHAPHWEQPEQFNRILMAFASECILLTV